MQNLDIRVAETGRSLVVSVIGDADQATALDTLIAVHHTLRDALPEAVTGHGQSDTTGENRQLHPGVPLETYFATNGLSEE